MLRVLYYLFCLLGYVGKQVQLLNGSDGAVSSKIFIPGDHIETRMIFVARDRTQSQSPVVGSFNDLSSQQLDRIVSDTHISTIEWE